MDCGNFLNGAGLMETLDEGSRVEIDLSNLSVYISVYRWLEIVSLV